MTPKPDIPKKNVHYLSSLLSADPWWGDEINETKMENMLFLLGGMMVVNLFIFILVAHNYQYQDPSTFEVQDTTEPPATKDSDVDDKKGGGTYKTFSEDGPNNDDLSNMSSLP